LTLAGAAASGKPIQRPAAKRLATSPGPAPGQPAFRVVKCTGCDAESRAAVEYALKLVSTYVFVSVDIRVGIDLTPDLGRDTAGLTDSARGFYGVKPAPLDTIVYPPALAKNIAAIDTGDQTIDIDIKINNNINFFWYAGTDANTATNEYDLVTAVLHETVHGMGVASSIVPDSSGALTWGFTTDDGQMLPSVFDCFLRKVSGAFLSSSSPLTKWWGLVAGDALRSLAAAAPEPDLEDHSYSHLRGKGLMAPQLEKNSAFHTFDAPVATTLWAIGWIVEPGAEPSVVSVACDTTNDTSIVTIGPPTAEPAPNGHVVLRRIGPAGDDVPVLKDGTAYPVGQSVGNWVVMANGPGPTLSGKGCDPAAPWAVVAYRAENGLANYREYDVKVVGPGGSGTSAAKSAAKR
jgi:hypothetical protein